MENFRLTLYVTANAQKALLICLNQTKREFKLRLCAQREKNKANAELVEFFSDLLHIPKKFVTIVSGKTSKTKLIEIEGISFEEFWKIFLQSSLCLTHS